MTMSHPSIWKLEAEKKLYRKKGRLTKKVKGKKYSWTVREPFFGGVTCCSVLRIEIVSNVKQILEAQSLDECYLITSPIYGKTGTQIISMTVIIFQFKKVCYT